jgi:aerobic carbon-monoxide dehydrogenase medium subunit
MERRVIATTFEYVAPTGLEDLDRLMSQEAVTVLGGGTWVIPEMTAGLRTPGTVADLRLLGLNTLEVGSEALEVGPMTTYAQVLRAAEVLPGAAQLLPIMAAGITGGSQIRNVGTIGGSACYASPSSDVPAVLVALRSVMHVRGSQGPRELSAESFFVDAFTPALKTDEVLERITVPISERDLRVGYKKFKLSESSYPIATAACLLEQESDGTVTSARVVVGAVCPTPQVVPVDDLLVGKQISGALEAIVERVRAVCSEPYEDVLASAQYRQKISGVIAKRALLAAGVVA